MSTTTDAMQDASRAARATRAAIWHRHSVSAAQSIHLPSTRQLLLGMDWHGGDLSSDARCFAQRILPRLDTSEPTVAEAHAKLSALTALPSLEDYLAAARAFRAVVLVTGYLGPDAFEIANRLDIYAAASGDRDSCLRVAELAVRMATTEYQSADVSGIFAAAALGWLAAARRARPILLRGGRAIGDDHRRQAAVFGNSLANDICARGKAEDNDEAAAEERLAKASGVRRMRGRSIADIMRAQQAVLDDGVPDDAAVPDVTPPVPTPPGIIVVQSIGMADSSEGKKVAELFNGIVGRSLPLVLAKDVNGVRQLLAGEFPHATSVIDAVLSGLVDGKPIMMPPTILAGEPGCGKTTLALRLLEVLKLPSTLYGCGGMADASVSGTARRWSSGEVSLPVSLARQHGIANPAIVLDEADKAGSSTSNGRLVDALLGFFEPTSSRCWHDPYVQAPVNLSAVCWLGTANSVADLPAPLRDRCRIITMPSPGPEHVAALGNRLLQAAIKERGLEAAWAQPLDGIECEMLASAWGKSRSIRGLGRLVDGVLAARDYGMARA